MDATRREYVYHLYAPAAEENLAARALSTLEGTHDFANLTSDEEGTVRTLETDCRPDGDFLEIRVAADGFPRHLVRRLVTVIDDVAHGRVPLDRVDRIFEPTPMDGKRGVGPAPAAGLLLWRVTYDVDFDVDDAARKSAHAAFENRCRYRATAGRVAAAVRDELEE